MDISAKTVDELKIIAYDLLVVKEQTEQNLRIVNGEIQKKLSEVKPIANDPNS